MSVSFVESNKFGGGGKTQTVTAYNGTKTQITDYASYFRKEEPPETVNYTSNPVTYSEIKQGTIGNEEFEAMAGTPTTRDLYFGTGGSEFIVDFEAALMKGQKAKRTYKVHYDGTECEFKIGDQSKDFTFPSPSGGGSGNTTISSMHDGGSCTVTWTGTTPWTGSGGVSAHTAWVTNSWDDSAYNAALAAANAYASTVNGTVYKYTAASDKVTRSYNSWGASASGSNPHISGSAQNGQVYIAPTPPDKDGKGGDPGQPFIAGQYTPGQANTWTITVRWTAPAHTNCGPCHTHDLPAINDTWTQEIPYDYFDITKAMVWKIEQSYLDGLKTITGTDSVYSQILQGNPNIFSNIAADETSRNGRFRYSVEPQAHDAVVWDKGARTNKCDKQNETWGTGIKYNVTGYPHQEGYLETNSSDKDKATAEYAEFKANREKLVEVTVISDFLILQTSSGDQSVLYFDKKSNKVQTQQDYAPVETTKAEGWDNNAKSAAKWSEGHINTGSYNGNYSAPSSKYNGNGSNNKTSTCLDNDPADTVKRTAHPSSSLRIAKYGIDVIDTLPNNDYATGSATTFWELKINYNPDNKKVNKKTAVQPLFGGRNGYVLTSNYSSNHFKINDIVIHDPVSAEYAMILSLNNNRDQRTADSAKWALNFQTDYSKCPGNPVECEFRELNCKYTGTSYHTVNCYTAVTAQTLNTHDHTVNCVDTAKLQQAFQPVSGSQEFIYTGNVQTFTAPVTGTYTFEVWGAQGGTSGYGGKGGYQGTTWKSIRRINYDGKSRRIILAALQQKSLN